MRVMHSGLVVHCPSFFAVWFPPRLLTQPLAPFYEPLMLLVLLFGLSFSRVLLLFRCNVTPMVTGWPQGAAGERFVADAALFHSIVEAAKAAPDVHYHIGMVEWS